MPDKNLTEQEWKKFAKGRDLKDAAMLKALASLEKVKDPAQQLVALAEVGKQADALRKSARGDKDLGKYLDGLDKAIASECRQAQLRAREEAASAARESPDEEDGPALLTTQAASLLRQVRKGGTMQALLAATGKQVAVLLSRRTIAPAKRKLLAEYLEATGAVKYIAGQCVFEENAYTFVVQSTAAGLAKRLKAALLEQTGLRVNVRVRGEDPNDIDEDAEAEDGQGQRAAGDAPAPAADKPAAQLAPSLPQAGDGKAAAAAANAGAAFNARLATLLPRIQAAAGEPSALDVKRKVSESGVFARKKDFVRANALLDQVEQMLGGQASQAAAPVPAPGSTSGAARIYLQSRQAWDATRGNVQDQLRRLEQAILGAYRDKPAIGEVQRSVRRLDHVAQVFDDTLSNVLEQLLQSQDAAETQRLLGQARATLGRLRSALDTDPLLAELDANPFEPVTVRSTLARAVNALTAQLG